MKIFSESGQSHVDKYQNRVNFIFILPHVKCLINHGQGLLMKHNAILHLIARLFDSITKCISRHPKLELKNIFSSLLNLESPLYIVKLQKYIRYTMNYSIST